LLERITEFLVASGPWAILLIAFIDSAGIPLAVGLDVLIILLSTQKPELAPLWVALAVFGSTTGNVVLFYIARKSGGLLLKPEPNDGWRPRFREWFHKYGLVTLFIPALIPIPMPMKFFVICSGCLGIPLFQFLFTVLIARIFRYSGEAYLGVQMGENSQLFLKQHRWDFAMFAVLLAIALYVLVRVTERIRAARPEKH
jgi:membrane protein YqaA with SNARE-associated domain